MPETLLHNKKVDKELEKVLRKNINFFWQYNEERWGEFSEDDVEIIINGDFLNLIQTDYKGHHTTVITESIDLYKVKSIVEGHRSVFESLKRFASRTHKRITYVVGNHDQGMLWQKTRDYLDEACGTRINCLLYTSPSPRD